MSEYLYSGCILWVKKKEGSVMKYICELCGYVYDEKYGDSENGIEAGTDFQDLPSLWVCPMCAADKDDFEPMEEE